jgi:hypothetical protein
LNVADNDGRQLAISWLREQREVVFAEAAQPMSVANPEGKPHRE